MDLIIKMGLFKLLRKLESDDRQERSKAIQLLGESQEDEAINILMDISKGKVLRTKKRGPWLLCLTNICYYYELEDQIEGYRTLAKVAKDGNEKAFNFLKTSLTYGIHNDTNYSEDNEHTHHFFYRKEPEPFMPAVLSFSATCSMEEENIRVEDYRSGAWNLDSEGILYPRFFEPAWRVVLPIKQELGLKGDDHFLVSKYLKSLTH